MLNKTGVYREAEEEEEEAESRTRAASVGLLLHYRDYCISVSYFFFFKARMRHKDRNTLRYTGARLLASSTRDALSHQSLRLHAHRDVLLALHSDKDSIVNTNKWTFHVYSRSHIQNAAM